MTEHASATPWRVPLTGCDAFHLALDAMMRRSGQGWNVGQLVLELDGALDVERVRHAAARLVAVHPIVAARMRRTWTGLPHWRISAAPDAEAVLVEAWREDHDDARPGHGARAVNAHAIAEGRLNEELDARAGRNLRLDVVTRGDGGSTLVVTFGHVLLDARGAELLIVELDRLSGVGGDGERVPGVRLEAPRGWGERISRAAPASRHLGALAAMRFRSLAGPRPVAGRARFRVATLDHERSAAARARAAELCGPFGTMPFFLAIAVRAHDRVFRARNVDPHGYVVTIPVQMRPKGQPGPIFQNHVSILFFHVERAALARVDDTIATVREQLAQMMRARLDEAFVAGLDLTRRLPSRLMIAAVRQQFHGEVSSFFHSFTGSFAPALRTFLGVPVRNAFHTPAVAAPPGTGLFIGERDGRLNVTCTWRDGVVTDDEASLLLAHAVDDCGGAV